VWLHVPSASSPYAPAAADSILPSDWRFEMLSKCAALNGKHTRPQSWHSAWKRASWMRVLFGRILKPSTAEHGVEQWIASLRDTPASRFQWRANDLANAIQDTYGLTFVERLRERARQLCSSRTCQGTLTLDSEKSTSSSRDWATELRAEFSARKKLERHTGEKDYSSSRWPTADATNRTRDEETLAKCAAFRKRNANQNTVPLYLAEVAANWPTPEAGNAKNTRNSTAIRKPGGSPNVSIGDTLCDAVQKWQTPASDSFRSRGGERKNEQGLDQQARTFEDSQCSRQVQPTSTNGALCSKDSRSSPRRLNPIFVCCLMGWPPGWSSARINSDFSEMALSHWVDAMRSALYSHVLGGSLEA
jgi:hypothetical protein